MKKLNDLAKLTAVCLIMAGTASNVSAKPAIRTSRQVTQPDGTTLTIRLVGDEHAHLYLTEDDCPVVWDDNLGFVYASVNDDGSQTPTGITAHDRASRMSSEFHAAKPISEPAVTRILESRMERRMSSRHMSNIQSGPKRSQGYGLSSTTFPSTGEQKAIVILVQFSDLAFGAKNDANHQYQNYSDSEDPVHDYWNDLLNKEGFNGFGGVGSCRDWFLANSADKDGNPQFCPQFDLYGPVTLPNNMKYYGRNNLYGDDENAYKMVVDACAILDDEVDFSQYDRDGDGLVDNIYIFYAGFGEADSQQSNTVWPHSWDLHYVNATFKVDGVTVDHYACSNETDYGRRTPDGIGTFVHEFSHVMGLPDLYTTVYNTAYTPGSYSVLDYGPYNNDGRTPPNYSAYERWALGWMTPEKYTGSGSVSLANLADTNEAYVIPTEKETEYFLVENRQQSGWDAYIPGHGMLIWHIDYVKEIFDNNVVNNTPSHQYVDLIEANGKKNEKYASGHTFPGTNNVTAYSFKSWSGKSCGVEFNDIKESEGMIVKDVKTEEGQGPSGIDSIREQDDEHTEYFNLQGIRVTNPAEGQILIRRSGGRTDKTISRKR